jgi:hypothetical protein
MEVNLLTYWVYHDTMLCVHSRWKLLLFSCQGKNCSVGISLKSECVFLSDLQGMVTAVSVPTPPL